MADQKCPCCGFVARLRDAPNVISACPECGQCLRLPAPWSSAEISLSGTRRLVLPFEELCQSAELGRSIFVPAELTSRVPDRKDAGARQQGYSLLGLLIAILLIAAPPFQQLQGDPLPVFIELATMGGGLFLLISSAFMLWNSKRLAGERSLARLVSVSGAPRETLELGTPQAFHQPRFSAQVAYLLVGVFSIVAGAVCLYYVLNHEVRYSRAVAFSGLGMPFGLLLLWAGFRNQGMRVLVFSQGLLVLRGRRGEVWRWQDLSAVILKPRATIGDDEVFVYDFTIRGHDGRTRSFTHAMEYFDNQLASRVQHEICAHLLPRTRAALEAGETIDFGQLQMTPEGLRFENETWLWSEIDNVVLDPENLIIQTQRRQWELPITGLKNLAMLIVFIQERRASQAPPS